MYEMNFVCFNLRDWNNNRINRGCAEKKTPLKDWPQKSQVFLYKQISVLKKNKYDLES